VLGWDGSYTGYVDSERQKGFEVVDVGFEPHADDTAHDHTTRFGPGGRTDS
jgi:hypothetical protein